MNVYSRVAQVVCFGMMMVVVLGSASCAKKPAAGTRDPNAKDIVIYKLNPPSPSGATCGVDNPLVNIGKSQTVRWTSQDDTYTLEFDNGDSPLEHNVNGITVTTNGTNTFHIRNDATYKKYLYAVKTNGNVCKKSSDVEDPGLNVKP